jgi:outer membrane lipoprotein-sorting protein
MFRKQVMSFLVIITAVSTAYNAQSSDTAREALHGETIVRRVDAIRIPRGDFSVDVTLESLTGSSEKQHFGYKVRMNSNRDALVQTTSPASEKGQTMLMRGQDFWLYLPSAGQPIRLSLSQKLIGPVSNGDIARMSFGEDYDVESVTETPANSEEIAVLKLKAKADWVTYERITLYVSAVDYKPIKAEFYTETGVLLKTCEFQSYKQLAGAIRPTQLIIHDAIRQGDKSLLSYSNMKEEPIPKRYFSKEYMQRLD